MVKPKTVPTTDELHERIRQSIRVHSFDADGAVERYFDYVQQANGLHIVVLACDIRKSTYLMKEANSAAAFARIMSNFVYYAREFVRISSSKGDCGEIRASTSMSTHRTIEGALPFRRNLGLSLTKNRWISDASWNSLPAAPGPRYDLGNPFQVF